MNKLPFDKDHRTGRFPMSTRPRTRLLALFISAAIAQLATGTALADSGVGVDTNVGNALNPRTVSSVRGEKDPDGMGEIPNSRTPTGLLNQEPSLKKEPHETDGGWQYNARAEVGVLGISGDRDNAKFKEYKDVKSGVYVNNFGLELEKPSEARFVDIRGGGIGRDDQFYSMSFGRYNDWKVKGFYSETPHVFTSTYRNIYNGVGSDTLTLKNLTPGGTTSAVITNTNIRNAVMATRYSELDIVRSKGGIRFDMNLAKDLKVFASYTQEKREGARPFGLVMGGGGGTGGLEIPESIDNDTHDFLAGLQWADRLSALNLNVSASFFRNDIDELTVQNPMFVAAANGIPAGGFPTARYDMHPDNNYYNIKGEYSRVFPEFYRSRFTAVVSASSLRQSDSLIPYTTDPLANINGIVGGQWDTLASLSDSSPNPKIDTRLIDLGLSLNPVNALDVRAKFRHYETKNHTKYWACNPLTGQWGRMLNDGSGVSAVNTPAYLAAGCNPEAIRALGIAPSAGNIPIRNMPFEHTQTNYTLAADYRLSRNNSLNASYERENFDREYRERNETREDKFKLGYVNRSIEGGTLRLSYEHQRKRGSTYQPDPYEELFSASFGPLPTVAGTSLNSWLLALAQSRKLDLADRDQDIVNLRFNYAMAPNLDGGVSLQWKDAKYPDSDYGRDDHQKLNSLNLDLNWHRSEEMDLYAFYSYQDGRISQAAIQSLGNCTLPAGMVTQQQVEAFMHSCIQAGSAIFPLNRTWSVSHKDKSDVAGLGLNYDFGKARLDMNYTYTKSRTEVDYSYGTGLGLTPAIAALAGNGFPSLTFAQHVIEANLLVPVNQTVSVRLLYRYEGGKIRDWHYDGVAVNPVPAANQQTYLDAGPKDYHVNLIGAMLKIDF